MNRSTAEICGKQAAAAFPSCNNAAATLRENFATVEDEDTAACVLHVQNLTNQDTINLEVLTQSAKNFGLAQKRVWIERVTNWLIDFGKAQLGKLFDASKDVDPYTHVARLVSDKELSLELRYGSTSSKFPWVSFGFS